MSTIINCAIAFTDVITAKYIGETNKDDHQAVVKLLRAALGNRLPEAQARDLASLLETPPFAKGGVSLSRALFLPFPEPFAASRPV
ncbi:MULTISPECIES: hypothetical protein [Rhizobium]|uniref:Uncharacterized protein n=1 Tax=Rhizobium phaseoli TaxID=396 RepID=A0A7X6F6P9_9HYPH|nr:MULTISPECIES: hypothetical protein [Rhizobium]MDE8761962.1 hypothetical protein [Rhizobium sp. CBK13]NKF13518.1 hypothetical protein [Rhizobium phaseoli]QPK10933.1 hypothetical protein HER27_010530 [Rhizobium phaseoli]